MAVKRCIYTQPHFMQSSRKEPWMRLCTCSLHRPTTPNNPFTTVGLEIPVKSGNSGPFRPASILKICNHRSYSS